MLKKILAKIQKLELQKQNKIASLAKIQAEKQAEIDDIDIKLKSKKFSFIYIKVSSIVSFM